MLTIVLYIRGIYCAVTAAGLQQQEFGFINGESCCCIRWWRSFYGGPTRICASESDFSPIFYIHFYLFFFIGVRRNESLKGNVNLLCCLAGSLYSIVGLYRIEYKVVH